MAGPLEYLERGDNLTKVMKYGLITLFILVIIGLLAGMIVHLVTPKSEKFCNECTA